MMKGAKEISNGIFEIIPLHKIREKTGEIWTEYMYFNSKNGTIIYDITLGHCLPSPETYTIAEFQELINRKGIENINGGLAFKRFINSYPEVFNRKLERNELNNIEEEIEL